MDPLAAREGSAPSQSRDHGLTHLGLVLEAMGWMKAVVVGFILVSLLQSASASQSSFGRHSQVINIQDTMFLAGLVSLLGAILLALAGRGLNQGSARAAKVYVFAGGFVEVVYVFILARQAEGTTLLVLIAGALALPILVAMALRGLSNPFDSPASDSLSAGSLVGTRFAKPEDGGSAGLVTSSGAGESHPRALTEPCVNLSAHTAPIRQTRPAYVAVRFMSHSRSPPATWLLDRNFDCLIQPLCSSRITSLHRSYELVRPSASHRYSHPNGFSHSDFSLSIETTGSRSSAREPRSDSRLLHAGRRLPSNQVSDRLVPGPRDTPGFDDESLHYDESSKVHLRSSL